MVTVALVHFGPAATRCAAFRSSPRKSCGNVDDSDDPQAQRKAIGLVLPDLAGKLDGVAIRVPTPTVSLVCLTAQVAKRTTAEEVNQALEQAAAGPLQGILSVEAEPLVSNDFKGNAHSSIVDRSLTQVVGDDLVEVQSWYDNEWGFSARMIDLARVVTA